MLAGSANLHKPTLFAFRLAPLSRRLCSGRARMDLFNLSTDVAVVIGGTGTLGGTIASGLASAGAQIAVVGRNADRGLQRVQVIREEGGRADCFVADALSRASLESCRDRIHSLFGPATILVNAAGGTDPKATVGPEQPFDQLPLDAWTHNFDLNLVGGVLLPCQVFGPAMIQRRRGSIINIASVSAHVPLSRVVAYSAAKAAVLSLTKFLAREWAPHTVRVNSITPGFFPAEQNRHILQHQDGSPTARAQSILDHTPMARFGQPHELVGVALLLASHHAASFITGADIPVDGGFLATTI
jgi:NAD(P)-dependent dehydrogenase (short-subunit alcohol dehydrogenase family)